MRQQSLQRRHSHPLHYVPMQFPALCQEYVCNMRFFKPNGVYLLQRQKISAFLIFLQPLYWWTRDYKVPSWTKQSIYFNKICSIWKKKKLISIFREWEREEGHAGQVSGLLYEVWRIKQREQWTRSNDWAGKACLWVPSEATKGRYASFQGKLNLSRLWISSCKW